MGFLEQMAVGFCWWDIPAVIVLFAVAVYVFFNQRKLRKEKKDLQGQL